jgi:hypothetical protein
MPKFIVNYYENFLLSGIFGPNFYNQKKVYTSCPKTFELKRD